MMRKYALIMTLLLFLGAFFVPQPEAKAMDPVTIAILAPIAIKVAKTMLPYLLKGMKNLGKHSVKSVKPFLDLFRLPLGFLQTLFLFPFGNNFSNGLRNIGLGVVAPFRIVWNILLIPFAIFGVG